jgi:hypothetical protein
MHDNFCISGKLSRFDLACAMGASLIFHLMLIVILTSNRSYYPTTGSDPRFDVIWATPAPFPLDFPTPAAGPQPDSTEDLQTTAILGEASPLPSTEPTAAAPLNRPQESPLPDKPSRELDLFMVRDTLSSLPATRTSAAPEPPGTQRGTVIQKQLRGQSARIPVKTPPKRLQQRTPDPRPLILATTQGSKLLAGQVDSEPRVSNEAQSGAEPRKVPVESMAVAPGKKPERPEELRPLQPEKEMPSDPEVRMVELTNERIALAQRAARVPPPEAADPAGLPSAHHPESVSRPPELKESDRPAPPKEPPKEQLRGAQKAARPEHARPKPSPAPGSGPGEATTGNMAQGVSASLAMSPAPAPLPPRPKKGPATQKRAARVPPRQAESGPEPAAKISKAVVARHAAGQPAAPSAQASLQALRADAAPDQVPRQRRLVVPKAAAPAIGNKTAAGSTKTTPPVTREPEAIPPADQAARPREKAQQARGPVIAALRGDLKIVMTGETGIKLSVQRREHPKSRRHRGLTRAEARREQTQVPILTAAREDGKEAVVETAREGIYCFRVEPEGNKEAKTTFTLKVFEFGPRQRVAQLGTRAISAPGVLFKILMPEAILWDDESAFTGALEDSESETKFNSVNGLFWKEFRD